MSFDFPLLFTTNLDHLTFSKKRTSPPPGCILIEVYSIMFQENQKTDLKAPPPMIENPDRHPLPAIGRWGTTTGQAEPKSRIMPYHSLKWDTPGTWHVYFPASILYTHVLIVSKKRTDWTDRVKKILCPEKMSKLYILKMHQSKQKNLKKIRTI